MADNVQTFYIRGETQFAKILGDPIPNYNKDGYEWKMDLVLDDAGVEQFNDISPDVSDRVKVNKKNKKTGELVYEGRPHISFKHSQITKAGNENRPITVVDAAGNTWPQDKLIGNGSKVDVKFIVMDFGKGKFPGVYIRAVRVLEHVPYEVQEFEPISEDDEFYKEAEEAAANLEAEMTDAPEVEQDDLDDEVPM